MLPQDKREAQVQGICGKTEVVREFKIAAEHLNCGTIDQERGNQIRKGKYSIKSMMRVLAYGISTLSLYQLKLGRSSNDKNKVK